MTSTADRQSLILHQYPVSPFSEKVRVAFAIKQLAWHACDQPVIMPKPEMVRLTGGYRRIPVLQVGADLWFDSLFIIGELERRQPLPAAFAGSGIGVAGAFARWCDGDLFTTVVGLLFGGDWQLDQAFINDRSQLRGAPFDPARMAAARPTLAMQLRQQLQLMEMQLADGRAFLTGAMPDAIDAAVYCQIAFIRWGEGATGRIVDEFALLCAWEKRVAALGHGNRQADIGREQAIAIARQAQPAPIADVCGDGVFSPGDAVSIKFHDANSPPLQGTLLRIDHHSLSIRPLVSEAGDIHIHMPRSVGVLSAAR